jgi:membrane associated rhomboid family serine protease
LDFVCQVMDQLGAKNDDAIFNQHEWWRVASCNWLHAGVIHLLFNMMGLYSIGVPLERRFGTWRIMPLYLISGLFGTMVSVHGSHCAPTHCTRCVLLTDGAALCVLQVSVIFMPGSISVGASASVFGLIGNACHDIWWCRRRLPIPPYCQLCYRRDYAGAQWADAIQNNIAVCRLRDSGLAQLTICTAVNVCCPRNSQMRLLLVHIGATVIDSLSRQVALGLTPMVDNVTHATEKRTLLFALFSECPFLTTFTRAVESRALGSSQYMHTGGLLAGFLFGVACLSKKQLSQRTGVRRRTCMQRLLQCNAALAFLVVVGAALVAAISSDASTRGKCRQRTPIVHGPRACRRVAPALP